MSKSYMSPKKAIKILSDYNKNGFNAYKTLIENGYTEMTAMKASKGVLQTAQKAIEQKMDIKGDSPKEVSGSVLGLLGITREDIIKELLKVIEQDRDYTNKLKAMSPVLREIGINLDNEEQKSNVAVLNITTREPKDPSVKPYIREVSDNIHSATQEDGSGGEG